MPTALEKLSEEERKEYWACLALKYAQNIGARTIAKLLKHFASAYEAVHRLEEWADLGAGHRIRHIQDNSWRERAKKEWENARDLDAQIILWTNEHYPPQLKEIPDAPAFFYAKGNLDLLKMPSLGVVGSRDSSPDGQNESAYIAKSLSTCGVTIISGMARGIDRAAHYGSLQGIGSSIGVLGSGIDVIYPTRNDDIYYELRDKGLLISEFPPGMPPDPTNFPIRNRIISGLSYGILVIEADLKSGSLITARIANEQDRQVYAVPGAMGSPFSKGCQELIRQGAKPVFRAEDILEDLLPLLKADLASLQKNISTFKRSDIPNYEEKIASEDRIIPQKPRKVPEEKSSEEIQKNNVSNCERNTFSHSVILANYNKESQEYAILSLLIEKRKQFDDLCQELNIPAQELNVLLTFLELQGTIVRFEGAWFEIGKQ